MSDVFSAAKISSPCPTVAIPFKSPEWNDLIASHITRNPEFCPLQVTPLEKHSTVCPLETRGFTNC